MNVTFNVAPKTTLKTEVIKEEKITFSNDKYNYAVAFIGPYSYCWNLHTDSGRGSDSLMV